MIIQVVLGPLKSPLNEEDPKNADNLKNEDDLRNKDDLKKRTHRSAEVSQSNKLASNWISS